MEIWKDIEGYEGYYQISNLGRVKALARTVHIPRHGRLDTQRRIERIRKFALDPQGYQFYSLNKFGKVKYFKAHRLIAKAFIPNPNNYPVINHKNGIKSDNRIENLEWCTISHNTQHAYDNGFQKPRVGEDQHMSKLTEQDVIDIRNSGQRNMDIATRYKITKSTVTQIKQRRSWKHI